MPQGISRVYGDEKPRAPVIGANSEVFVDGTFVSKNSSGFLIAATAGLKIWGICRQNITMASTNQTVAQVCPLVIEANNVDSYMTADQALVQADIGKFAAISTVSAGVQTLQLSTASTTVGALSVHGLKATIDGNPSFVGDTTTVEVRPSTPQDFAFSPT